MSQPPGPDATLGEVDDYQLLESIRETSSGVLYRAQRKGDGGLVLLKRIRGGLGGEVERARFARELAVLRKLVHPHLAALVDYRLDGDRPYFVTEHLRGDALEAMVGAGRRPWPADELARLAEELLGALESLHAAGVVLRGLTPAAVLHDDDGRFRVVDLAGVMHQGWRKVSVDGQDLTDLGYVAPEVLEGGEHSVAGDLYQLGALLYEAATGRAHPPGEAPGVVAAREGLPAPLVELIDGLRARDPAARPASASGAAAALRRGLEDAGRPPITLGIPSPRVAEAAARPRPPPWTMGAVLALGLAVGFLLVGRQGPTLHDVAVERRAGAVEVSWRSSRPYAGVVVVDGPGGTRRVEGPVARRHQLRLVLPAEGRYRVELETPGGGRQLAGLLDPAQEVEVGVPRLSYPPEGGVAVGLDTRPACPVVLRWQDAAGAPHEVRSPARGRHHLVAPFGASEVPAEAWLEVEAPGGVRWLPLDPAAMRGPAARARLLARRLALRGRRTVAEIYALEGRLVGMQAEALEALGRRRVMADWEELAPLARRLLAAPPAEDPGLAAVLRRTVSDLGDLRGIFHWVGIDLELENEAALAPAIRARHERYPEAEVPGPEWAVLAEGPLGMVPEATVLGLTRLLPMRGKGRDRPELAVTWALPEAPRGRVELLVVSSGLHHAFILEAYVGGVWVGALRGHQPRGMEAFDDEPTFTWDFLEVGAEALRAGENRVRLVARSLHGIPVSEAVSVVGVYARVVPAGGAR